MVIMAATILATIVLLGVFAPDLVSTQPLFLPGLSSIVLLLATGLLALLRQGEETHQAVNSRLTQLLEATERKAAAEAILATQSELIRRAADDARLVVLEAAETARQSAAYVRASQEATGATERHGERRSIPGLYPDKGAEQ